MKLKTPIAALAALLLFGLAAGPCQAWGPSGHKIINGLAVDSLPPGPVRALLEKHRAYLSAHATDPDLWHKQDPVRFPNEGFHHFMDIDRYGKPPFLDLPRSRADAEKKYGAETVLKNGTVPWTVGDWYLRCVDDMRKGDTTRVLVDAVVLAHYGADAHVPFHAVENYDGQLTNQKGVHARFETMLVDRFVHPETLKASPVRYLDNPVSAAFGWIVESASDVPGVLDADRIAHARFPDYTSDGYQNAFWQAVGPLVNLRLSEGAGDVASLWYSAWIAAGQPPLDAPAAETADTGAVAD